MHTNYSNGPKAIMANLPYRRSGIEKSRFSDELVIDELAILDKERKNKSQYF